MRLSMINKRRKNGENPFPHKFQVTVSLADFVKKYDHIENGTVLVDTIVNIAGIFVLICFSLFFFKRANRFQFLFIL